MANWFSDVSTLQILVHTFRKTLTVTSFKSNLDPKEDDKQKTNMSRRRTDFICSLRANRSNRLNFVQDLQIIFKSSESGNFMIGRGTLHNWKVVPVLTRHIIWSHCVYIYFPSCRVQLYSILNEIPFSFQKYMLIVYIRKQKKKPSPPFTTEKKRQR